MTRKKKIYPVMENIPITDIAAEGMSITRVDNMVVFVPHAVPGDIVDIQITRKKHSYAQAEVKRFVSYGQDRVNPECIHFGTCGGCKWQMLPYEKQLFYKRKQVEDQLHRIAKIPLPEINPILGSDEIYAYRNKLEFAFSNKKWLTPEQIASGEVFEDMDALGFHINGAFDKILPIEQCRLMHQLNDDIRNEIRDYAKSHGLSFFDIRQRKGLLRGIMLRKSDRDCWMLLIQFFMERDEDLTAAQGLMRHIAEKFSQITSLLFVNNTKANDTFNDLTIEVFKGDDHIMEHMEDLTFKVGPKSFYQTNTRQAHKLYSVARRLAGLTGREIVYDLYTGTGTIANFVARKARAVIGIEYVPEAIEDAKVNSQINGINNITFYAGDMKDVLDDALISRHGKPDVIITDPPRAGMHDNVIQTILRARPDRIVYVSCNPATQARDLAGLSVLYDVREVQPVDMFPHTPHIENVVLLTLKETIDEPEAMVKRS